MIGPDWHDGQIRTRMIKLSIGKGRVYEWTATKSPWLNCLAGRMPLAWTVRHGA